MSEAKERLCPPDKRNKKRYKIIVVGKMGTGKSALCNKLLGKETFAAKQSLKPVTTVKQEATVDRSGLDITVVDTYDISSDTFNDTRKSIVEEWKKSTSGFIYIVVLTIRCDERVFTYQQDFYLQLKKLWGRDLRRRLVVAFTFGDKRQEGEDIHQEIKESPPELQRIIKEAGGRFVVFSNKPGDKDEGPVFKLIHTMQGMGEQKPCSPSKLKCRLGVFTVCCVVTAIVVVVVIYCLPE